MQYAYYHGETTPLEWKVASGTSVQLPGLNCGTFGSIGSDGQLERPLRLSPTILVREYPLPEFLQFTIC